MKRWVSLGSTHPTVTIYYVAFIELDSDWVENNEEHAYQRAVLDGKMKIGNS